MKVMVIVKATPSSEAGVMPSEKLLADMGAYNEELVKAGVMQAGEGLHPSSKGKRVRFGGGEKTVIDGPFAETKELIAGFWIWQVKSMDEAVAWLKKCPDPMPGEESEIEIRQIFSAEDFGAEFTPELREQEARLRAETLLPGCKPRVEELPDLVLAGPKARYTAESRSQIGAAWDKFAPQIGKVPGQVGGDAYGAVWNCDDQCGFDYMPCVAVESAARAPAGFTTLDVPVRRYVVLTHVGPIATLPSFIDTVWSKWAPECGLKLASTAPCLERYTAAFDAVKGGTELWIPLA